MTDAATELTTAEFGAFFYNVVDDRRVVHAVHDFRRAARGVLEVPDAAQHRGLRADVQGHGVVRSDDITKDPRYGHNAPYHGMPRGHLPVRSYLAVPVRAGPAT